MSTGIEIVNQINVVREVIDIRQRDRYNNTKGDYIGNYPVDIQNPKDGDMLIFKNNDWVKISKEDLVKLLISDSIRVNK